MLILVNMLATELIFHCNSTGTNLYISRTTALWGLILAACWSLGLRGGDREHFCLRPLVYLMVPKLWFPSGHSPHTMRAICEPHSSKLFPYCQELISWLQATESTECISWSQVLTSLVGILGMWNLFALMISMGLVSYSKISEYCSRYILYHNTFVPAVMSRNKFQDILRVFLFADNTLVGDDRLAKVQPLVLLLVQNFKKFKTQGAVTVIEETVVPFRGQMILNKAY